MEWGAALSVVGGLIIASITFWAGRRNSQASIIGNQSATITNQSKRITYLEAENKRLNDRVIMLEQRLGQVLMELDELRGQAS